MNDPIWWLLFGTMLAMPFLAAGFLFLNERSKRG